MYIFLKFISKESLKKYIYLLVRLLSYQGGASVVSGPPDHSDRCSGTANHVIQMSGTEPFYPANRDETARLPLKFLCWEISKL